MFDLDELLKLLIVLRHQLIRLLFFLLKDVIADFDQVPPSTLLVFYPTIPCVKGIVSDEFSTLLEILDLVYLFLNLGEAAHVRPDLRNLSLLIDGVCAFTLKDLLETLGLKGLLDHT